METVQTNSPTQVTWSAPETLANGTPYEADLSIVDNDGLTSVDVRGLDTEYEASYRPNGIALRETFVDTLSFGEIDLPLNVRFVIEVIDDHEEPETTRDTLTVFVTVAPTDFMPLAVGNSWSYAYVYEGVNHRHYADSLQGHLTWLVVSSEKRDEDDLYVVDESFEGSYREQRWNSDNENWEWSASEPHTWTREIRMIETSEGVLLDLPHLPPASPYIVNGEDISWRDAVVPRYYSTSADTVFGDGDAAAHPIHHRFRWHLVKHQGITYFELFQDRGVVSFDNWTLTLTDFSTP